MSRHIFRATVNNQLSDIVVGWDAILQGYFMDITVVGGDNAGDVLYDNTYDPAVGGVLGHIPQLDYFLRKLDSFGVNLPAAMLADLACDKAGNVQNRIVRHDA